MTHIYYQYDKEALLNNPKIKLFCEQDNERVFGIMAEEMLAEIEENNRQGRRTVMICPVGPVGQYPHFVKLVNEKRVSLKQVWFINMDEYLDENKGWIDIGHPLSFRGYMERNVYGQIDPELLMPPEQRIFPDPKNIAHIPELIERLGGVDAVFGGIGINGHVAFNEAQEDLSKEEFLALPTRVLAIAPETRAANAIGDFGGALEDMPKYCVTVGMREIYQAKKIRLACMRSWHRAVVRRAAHGESSTAFPVSLLQEHSDVSIRFSDFVAHLEV